MPKNTTIPLVSKLFCSDRCVFVFKTANMVSCECDPKCQIKFLRQEGTSRFGKWFCSNECLEKDVHVDSMIKQKMVEVPDMPMP